MLLLFGNIVSVQFVKATETINNKQTKAGVVLLTLTIRKEQIIQHNQSSVQIRSVFTKSGKKIPVSGKFEQPLGKILNFF